MPTLHREIKIGNRTYQTIQTKVCSENNFPNHYREGTEVIYLSQCGKNFYTIYQRINGSFSKAFKE
jgi:hypothetical protein